jgi:hypothetical protein
MITICSILFRISLLLAAHDQSKLRADESRILTLENGWNKAEEHKDRGL